jgi:hypothetical protein
MCKLLGHAATQQSFISFRYCFQLDAKEQHVEPAFYCKKQAVTFDLEL